MLKNYFLSRDKCVACTSTNVQTLYSKSYCDPRIREYLEKSYSTVGRIELEYLNNAEFILSECKNCGLIFQREIPDEVLMELLYNKWINPEVVFNQHLKNDDLNFYSRYAQEISTILAYINKVPADLSIFDFGMGWGKWALMAKAFGCQSYGSELSKERVKYATQNGVNVISWNDISNHSFDFINTEQVFEHLPNPLETLKYIKTALKPDGILKISVPTANNILRRLKFMDWQADKGSRHSLNPIAPLEHVNYFRRKSLIHMTSLAGMKEVVIPMKTQYAYTTSWTDTKTIAKNIIMPIYRNILKKQNYLFFKNE